MVCLKGDKRGGRPRAAINRAEIVRSGDDGSRDPHEAGESESLMGLGICVALR